jgi:hypothetical protein
MDSSRTRASRQQQPQGHREYCVPWLDLAHYRLSEQPLTVVGAINNRAPLRESRQPQRVTNGAPQD